MGAVTELDTGIVLQVAIVVRDLDAKVREWTELLGVDPSELQETAPQEEVRTEYRGKATDARCRLAIFDLGQMNLEVLEPVGQGSVWAEHLDKYGEGLHHVAFRVRGMADALATLDARGVPLVQRAEFEDGRYAYVDGAEKLGVMLELLEFDPAHFRHVA